MVGTGSREGKRPKDYSRESFRRGVITGTGEGPHFGLAGRRPSFFEKHLKVGLGKMQQAVKKGKSEKDERVGDWDDITSAIKLSKVCGGIPVWRMNSCSSFRLLNIP